MTPEETTFYYSGMREGLRRAAIGGYLSREDLAELLPEIDVQERDEIQARRFRNATMPNCGKTVGIEHRGD
jgi:hypothetical protein